MSIDKSRRKAASRIIERFTGRTLPEFEEHRLAADPWPEIGAYQPANWRSGDYNPIFGRYECLDCGGRHTLPGLGSALICESLTDAEARTRAVGRVERRLAAATGQHQRFVDTMLSDLSGEIVRWAEYYPRWGRGVLAEYGRHPMLESYIVAMEAVALPDGDNVRPPPNAGEMIYKHLPLVRRLAKDRATMMGADGLPAINDSLFSDLEAVGMAVLEASVNRFDPTRGVTFGAYVRKRLAGAMDDWLQGERIVSVDNAYEIALDGATVADERRSANAPKRHRTSTGGYREAPYISNSERPVRRPAGVHAGRLIRGGIGRDIEAALEKLNPRQREVYRGRVLSDPPVPRSVLASRLGIRDERQIPRIEKQARQKMAKLLKVSPP